MNNKEIEIEPSFLYQGKTFRLDYISKEDNIFLQKIFI